MWHVIKNLSKITFSDFYKNVFNINAAKESFLTRSVVKNYKTQEIPISGKMVKS